MDRERRIVRGIYLLYIFLIPLERVFYRPTNMGMVLTMISASTIVMFVGFIIMVLKDRNALFPRKLNMFWGLFCFMSVYSLVVAYFVSMFQPFYHGHSVLLLPMTEICVYFAVIMSLLYNYHYLTTEFSLIDLRKPLSYSAWLVIIVGFLQLGIINGNGPCLVIYTALTKVFFLLPPEAILTSERGAMCWGSEVSTFFNCFILLIPYLFILGWGDLFNNREKRIYKIQTILLLFIATQSGSSSVSIGLVFFMMCAIMFICHIKISKKVVIGANLVGLTMSCLYTIDINFNTGDHQSFEYQAVGKVVDRKNKSTQNRSSTVAVDMKEFVKFPVTGVGDGLQGLWYNELTPSWTRSSEEVQTTLKKGIVNGGGNFFPAYLAAFGMIGIIVFLLFLRSYMRVFRTSYIAGIKEWRNMFNMAISLAMLVMWYMMTPRLNEFLILLIVLPCISRCQEQKLMIKSDKRQ